MPSVTLAASIERLLAKREVKKAEVQIAKALRGSLTPELHAKLLALRARAKLYTGRPEGALDDLARAREIHPALMDDSGWLELLADSHFARYELSAVGFAERSDAQQAELLYHALLQNHAGYTNLGWVNYQLARVMLVSNRITDATECLHHALVTPSHVAALTSYCYERLGFIAFYEERTLSQALTFLDKAVQTYPTGEDRGWMVQLYLLRGRILRDSHRLSDALEAAETALRIAMAGRGESRALQREALFTSAEILSRIEGQEHRIIGVIEQFFQISRKPQTIDVTYSRAYEMLGDAYAAAVQHEQAITAYLASLQFNPYHPWEVSIYTRIARAYYQQGNYERTVTAIQRALDIAKAEGQAVDFQVYDLLGSAHYALGQYEQAVAAFDEALARASSTEGAVAKIQQYRGYAAAHLQQDPVMG